MTSPHFIVFANEKGGTGKSTTAVHTAVALAAAGHRVAALDLDQRQRIDALEQAVEASREDVAALEAESDRWKDPAYITTQARERLYYVRPGEVVYLVDNDLEEALLPQEPEPASDEVVETRSDWMAQLVRSVTSAGVADVVRGPTIGVPDPATTPAPSG